MLHITGSRRLEGMTSLVISTKVMSVGMKTGIREGGSGALRTYLETARQGSGLGHHLAVSPAVNSLNLGLLLCKMRMVGTLSMVKASHSLEKPGCCQGGGNTPAWKYQYFPVYLHEKKNPPFPGQKQIDCSPAPAQFKFQVQVFN